MYCQHRHLNTGLIIPYLAALLGGCSALLCCDQHSLLENVKPQESDWVAVCLPTLSGSAQDLTPGYWNPSLRGEGMRSSPLSGAERFEIGWVFSMGGGEGIHNGGLGSAPWKPKI